MIICDTGQPQPGDLGLTCIHCAATPDTDSDPELERIYVENFLGTLAEIARAIARRNQEKQECEQ